MLQIVSKGPLHFQEKPTLTDTRMHTSMHTSIKGLIISSIVA
jgi:hypothetical protein